jgi:GTP pyrophosphokinase
MMPPLLSDRFEQALSYACQLHRQQTRKISDTPYVGHLLAVAALVLEHGGGEDEAIAALLHDAVEDQGGAATRQAIALRFGERVARIVDAASDADGEPKPPWKERKLAHLARLRTADAPARLVLAADKLHNARSLARDLRARGAAVWQSFNGGRDGTLWYYRAMRDALADGWRHPILAELDDALAQLESLAGQESQ